MQKFSNVHKPSKETNMRIAITLTLIITALSFGEGQTKKIDLPKELQGDIIPSFTLLMPDNETRLKRDDFAKEAKKLGAKRVVFSFFASWCLKNCAPEFVVMKDNIAKLKEKGVQVYLIDVREDLIDMGDKVKEFVEKYADNKFPYYFDQKGKLLKDFGLVKKNEYDLPTIVVMDGDLRVLYVLEGEAGNDFPQVIWEGL
jgi:peroxiredoxin